VKRTVLLTALVLVLSFAVHGTASASVSNLTLDAKAQLAASKISAVATGTVTCTAGDDVSVSVVIVQASGKVNAAATGSASVTCTGTVQTVAVTTDVVVGAALKHGPAIAVFSASDNTDSTSFPTLTQDIKLS
jgi:hypothetical protein